MYKFLAANRLLAAVKPESAYEWFVYKGSRPVAVTFRGKEIQVKKGQEFGVRKSANGRQIRMIFPGDPSRVITLTLEQAERLARHVG